MNVLLACSATVPCRYRRTPTERHSHACALVAGAANAAQKECGPAPPDRATTEALVLRRTEDFFVSATRHGKERGNLQTFY